MKKIPLFLMLIIFICHANGQSKYDVVLNYFIDTAALYVEVKEAIQKCENLNGYTDIKIIPIYFIDDFSKHSKQDYLDGTFLRNLSPLYYQKSNLFQKPGIRHVGSYNSKSWLITVDEFLLLDDHGSFVAKVESGLFGVYPCIPSSDSVLYISPKSFLTDLISTHDFDFVFRTSRFSHLYKEPTVYFGVNKHEESISVIIHTIYGCKVFSIEDIINYHWEDFQNQLTLLKYEVNEELKNSFKNKMCNISYKLCVPFY